MANSPDINTFKNSLRGIHPLASVWMPGVLGAAPVDIAVFHRLLPLFRPTTLVNTAVFISTTIRGLLFVFNACFIAVLPVESKFMLPAIAHLG